MPKELCLNLFGSLWVRDPSWVNKYVINHERIHTAQQKELLWIPFYILYFIEWVVRLFQYRDLKKAYMNISFEREAYSRGHNLGYLQNRKPFAWLDYLKMDK